MVGESESAVLREMTRWLLADRRVHSAVLFGSMARPGGAAAAADAWSDVDLHLVVSEGEQIERLDWAALVPDVRLALKVSRPATGGVRKLTLLFAEGEADLVLVPVAKMRLLRFAMRLGVHRRVRRFAGALDAFATIMSGGYCFLKGEEQWGRVYAEVARMPGVRFDNAAAVRLAEVFLSDFLWVLQKIERGELVAAQRILHQSLLETNVVLLHELRIRQGLPTFQQARRVERLVTPAQLAAVTVGSRLEAEELSAAAWGLRAGLDTLMLELVPGWSAPQGMESLLRPYRLDRRRE